MIKKRIKRQICSNQAELDDVDNLNLLVHSAEQLEAILLSPDELRILQRKFGSSNKFSELTVGCFVFFCNQRPKVSFKSNLKCFGNWEYWILREINFISILNNL